MNLGRELSEYLPEHILELVRNLSEQATKLEQRVYLVGGVVRDLLLGQPNFDLDVVVEGDALKLAQRLVESTQARLVAHPRFGTAKLKCQDFTLDLATARKETYARPGALPTVSPGSLEDDLFRRDFSINAMAVSLTADHYGELIDPHQGKSDLDRRLIRILHPQSFIDDATRILRAVRYEQRLGFKLEEQTAELLKRDIPMLDTISGDRIRHELELIFEEKQPELVVERLGELRVLSRINPSLKGNGWIAEKFEAARRLRKPSQLPLLYYCLLVYPLSADEIEQLLARLNTSGQLSRAARDTIRLKTNLHVLEKPAIKPSEIYYLLREYEPLAIETNAIACDSPTIQDRLQLFLTKLRYVRTSLGGGDLKRLGIPAGPEMGRLLQMLHKAKLDGEVTTRGDEKKFALSFRAKHLCTEAEPDENN